jgi:hypothetical protein
MAAAQGDKIKVVVSGAGGRTGSLVMKQLLQLEQYQPVGVVRSEKSAAQLRQWGAGSEDVVVADLLEEGGAAALAGALAGAAALVICTSAVPKIQKRSLVRVLLAKLFRREGVRPTFTFKKGQMPEQADWDSQRMQIDAARAAGAAKVVVCGSMGGTDRANFLNTIGEPWAQGAVCVFGGPVAAPQYISRRLTPPPPRALSQATEISWCGSGGRSGTSSTAV